MSRAPKRKRKRQRPAPRLYPLGVDVAGWCKRYGLEPFSHPCAGCGELKRTTIPFAQGTLRGLASPPCPCGDESLAPYCLVRDPKHGDLFSGDLSR